MNISTANSKAETEENQEFCDDKSNFINTLVNSLEKLIERDENLPFRITDVKPNGFTVKIAGLYGYIAYQFMPWKYSNSAYWRVVFPTLTNKVFFCKVFQFTKDPLSIILNGNIPQFKKPDLIENEVYKGIVINKVSFGIFIDIGIHFRWKCGSLTGLLHKSNLNTPESFENIQTGDVIDVFYWGLNRNEEMQFGCKIELTEWLNGNIDDLKGEVLPVRIEIKPESTKIEFLVDEKYNGTLPLTKTIYNEKKKRIINAISLFKNGDLIHCEVIKINKLNRTLQLKWEMETEITEISLRKSPLIMFDEKNKIQRSIEYSNPRYALENRINHSIVEKLHIIAKPEDHDLNTNDKHMNE